MLSSPRIGQHVVINYAKKKLPMPYHGHKGTVVVVGKGKPRNHLIQTEAGHRFVVPDGNLNKVEVPS